MSSPTPPSAPGPAAAWSRLDALALGVIAILWSVVLLFSGAVTSGYHLTDDHEIVSIAGDLTRTSPWRGALGYVGGDLHYRFRPLYGFHRVAEVAVFGDHFAAWSVYTAVLGLLCAVLLYGALRSLAFSPWEALLFPVLGLAGVQSEMWWRLGPSESLGMVFLAAAVLALGRHATTGSRAARVGFVGAVLLASLSKESFVLATPALLFAYTWAWRSVRGTTWAAAVRRTLPEGAILASTTLLELLFIVLRVGTERIGYAGVAGITAPKVLATAVALATFGRLWWLVLTALVLASAFGGGRALLRAAAPTALLLVAIIVPQAILYTKSGLQGRYYLPAVLGPAFAVAVCLRYLRTHRRSAHDAATDPDAPTSSGAKDWVRRTVGSRRLGAVLAVAVAVLAFLQVREARRLARSFALAGDGSFVERLRDVAASGPILVVGGIDGVSEHFWSLRRYLDARASGPDVSFEFIDHELRSDFVDHGLRSDFVHGLVKDFEANRLLAKRDPARGTTSFAAVGVLPGAEAAFLSRSEEWFDPSAYSRQEIGRKRYVVYARLPGAAPAAP
jgi:hypothetical protein